MKLSTLKSLLEIHSLRELKKQVCFPSQREQTSFAKYLQIQKLVYLDR